jgi:hypothetical protein
MYAATKTDAMLSLWTRARARRVVQTERQAMDRRLAEAEARAVAEAPAPVAEAPRHSAGPRRAAGDR